MAQCLLLNEVIHNVEKGAMEMKNAVLPRMNSFLFVGLLIVSGGLAHADTGGYPWYSELQCTDARCVDPYGFYYRQCTSFVAWKLDTLAPSLRFHNTMRGGRFGSASNWATNAQRIGFKVDKSPAVNAVAQIGGHVAIVKSIEPRGKITIEEYNWGSAGSYGRRTILASVPDNYIHIADSTLAKEPDGSEETGTLETGTLETGTFNEQDRSAPAEASNELTACTVGASSSVGVRRVIQSVFGAYGDQAVRVAACESGPWGTRAVNGQYLGLFQMGRTERAKYGHSDCAETQASAAYAYFKASGSNWSPWSCKPW